MPKATKKPKIVRNMTMFPVRTSMHAPHSMTFWALASTMGRAKAERTMPVVTKWQNSLYQMAQLRAASIKFHSRLIKAAAIKLHV